jgi:hypothetical protein
MLCNTKTLTGYTLRATDGEIGSVEDFYFDDEAWAIRYLVVDTGKWLPGRKVLISPISLGAVDDDGKKLDVKLNKNQVENSPDIDKHKPISRQHESELFRYYNYPYYWAGPYLWGPIAYPAEFAVTAPDTQVREIKAAEERANSEDRHLRSTREVANYSVHASDGEIGHVEDFVVDGENWAIRYVIVDTKNWLPGKKVLVSPQWIKQVSWSESAVYFDVTREAIKSSPEYDPSVPLGRDYEKRLHEHHKRPGYWGS